MQNKNVGVLFVHGIMGSPSQFDFITEQLPEGTEYLNITLPGHGSDLKAFKNSGAAQWQAAVDSAAMELKDKCKRMVFVGHSMGCLLGLNTAVKMPGAFADMLLLCCPFRIRFTLRYLRENVRAFEAERKNESPVIKAAREAQGVKAKHPLALLFCTHPYMELLRLICASRRLPKPDAERLIFCFSERDEIVGLSSARAAEEQFDGDIALLKDCGHNYFTPESRESICKMLAELIADDPQ